MKLLTYFCVIAFSLSTLQSYAMNGNYEIMKSDTYSSRTIYKFTPTNSPEKAFMIRKMLAYGRSEGYEYQLLPFTTNGSITFKDFQEVRKTFYPFFKQTFPNEPVDETFDEEDEDIEFKETKKVFLLLEKMHKHQEELKSQEKK